MSKTSTPRAKAGNRVAAASLVFAVAIVAAATGILNPSLAAAGDDEGPVQYVKVCSLYNATYNYVPGTDTCHSIVKNDARVQTEGGTWRWRMPNNPRRFAKSPKKACKDGTLVKFADLNAAALKLNIRGRAETTMKLPLSELEGQFITKIIYQGGFTGVGRANFCMFHYYENPDDTDPKTPPEDPEPRAVYTPMGCVDTAAQAATNATITFVPDSPIPPVTPQQLFIVGAAADRWGVTLPDDVGDMSVWLCLGKTS